MLCRRAGAITNEQKMKKTSKIFMALLLGSAATFSAGARTVFFSEDFNTGSWTESFPVRYDGDKKLPVQAVRAAFFNSDGVLEPWWPVKDSQGATNRFLGSVSSYDPSGQQANDWVCSRAIEIPTEGFVLTFEAQSQTLDGDNSKLSDLNLYILESSLDTENLPATPSEVYRKVSWGEDNDVMDGDFSTFEVSLDRFAGKTIYIAFSNLNTDKDILAIDNVVVSRNDRADVSVAELPAYISEDAYTAGITITGTHADGLANWVLTVNDGESEVLKKSGDLLKDGESLSFNAECSAAIGNNTLTVTLTGDNQGPIVVTRSVMRTAFTPVRRVLIEETTNPRCGNCPIGIYNIEEMMKDEDLNEHVIPVSVHIPMGWNFLVNETYTAFLGLNAAPVFILNRVAVLGVGEIDYQFDKNRQSTLGHTVYEKTKELALLSLDVDAEYVRGSDGKVKSVKCTSTITPAVDLDPAKCGIGYILVENDVTNPDDPTLYQTNYVAGYTADMVPSRLNGWCELPEKVFNVRYQHVARGVYEISGMALSHSALEVNKPVTEEYSFDLPEVSSSVLAINPEKCIVIAYVVETEGGEVLNAASCPMSDIAEECFSTADLLEEYLAGVKGVTVGSVDDAPVYYNLQGIRVNRPSKGVYIEARGGKTSKVVF